MKNKININNVNFEFANYVNKNKFKCLNRICNKLNKTQKKEYITTCSQRRDLNINNDFNEICQDNDNDVNKILNYITNDDILIILDTEFQTFDINNKKKDYVRELAMLVFVKHSSYNKTLNPSVNVKWTHLIDIFVNFELLNNKSSEFDLKNMNCITSDYASVTLENKEKIHKLFHQLPNIRNDFKIISEFDNIIDKFINDDLIDFSEFDKLNKDFKKIKKDYKNNKFNSCKNLANSLDIFEEILNIYKNDEFVKNRSLNDSYSENEFLKDLNKLFNQDVTVIVKGDSDIVSLKNSNSYYNNSHFGIRHIIDIARQNNYYHSLNLGSAQLEHTYMFLRYGLNPSGKQIKKEFFNPASDNSSLNDKITNQVSDFLDLTFPGKFKSNNFNFHNPLDDCIATFCIIIMLTTNTHIGVLSNMIETFDPKKYLEIDFSYLGKYLKNLVNLTESEEQSIDDKSDSSELILNF
jgi:hypothetical protein